MRDSIPTYIATSTGRRFYPLAPSPKDLCWEDIAHALSQINRFTGHSKVPYSVAEHSVYVSRRAESLYLAKREDIFKNVDSLTYMENAAYCARWGLLHDASEAYLSDVAKPLKVQDTFAGYRAAELCLQSTIVTWAGLDVQEPAEVTQADAELLATEASQIMAEPLEPDTWYFKYPAVPGLKIQCWDAKVAELEFLARAKELGML